jgi:hypothetical protein
MTKTYCDKCGKEGKVCNLVARRPDWLPFISFDLCLECVSEISEDAKSQAETYFKH